MEFNVGSLETSKVVAEMLEKYPVRVTSRLGELLHERNITQKVLHELTGLRLATISDLVNARRQSVNLSHIAVIMVALRITDIREIISFEIEESIVEAWKEETKGFEHSLSPLQRQEARENVMKMIASN